MNLEELRTYKPQILALAEKAKISDIRVFGSVARGEAGSDSDIDLLVRADPSAGWDFFGFYVDLEELLGCKVDVVDEKAVNKYIRDQVFEDATPL